MVLIHCRRLQRLGLPIGPAYGDFLHVRGPTQTEMHGVGMLRLVRVPGHDLGYVGAAIGLDPNFRANR